MDTVTVIVFLITVGVAVSTTHHRFCYKDYPILDGLICYKKCAPGYSHYGGGPICWAICPPRTRDIGAVCVKNTYGRGVGTVLSTCRSTHEKKGLLCYPKCRSGYYGVGPVCWSRCHGGYHDDGALCRRNMHSYTRNANACHWSNNCGWRYHCGHSCKSGYNQFLCYCIRGAHIYAKNTYGRGGGSAMGCKSNEQKHGALCYPHCASGYYGVGPVCWAYCAGNTVDTGAQCQKKSYGRGVGKAINCLKVPTIKDLTNFTGLVELFKKAKNLQKLQAIGCSYFYLRSKFWIRLIQTFNNCNKKGNWQTISLSFSVGAAAGVTVSTEVGIGVDIMARKGICYIGYCYGVVTDVSIGGDIGIGWWRKLSDIPGKSTVKELGVDIPFTEVGITAAFIVNTDHELIGTQFLFGTGVGLMPFEVGWSSCDTPENAVIKFTA